MKMRFVVALAGLAISFALPAFAQQKDAADPQIRQQLDALGQKYEAFNNGTQRRSNAATGRSMSENTLMTGGPCVQELGT